MAGRYTKLYEFPCGFYASGAPVMIRGGALLRDSFSQNVLAQFKLYSLDSRTIKGVKLAIGLYDRRGESMGNELLRTYTNIRVERDDEFGQHTALVLPYRDVCSITARVTEVLFSNGARWEAEEDLRWEPVERPITLREYYDSEEMAAQFRIRYGIDCLYAPQDLGALWQCTCGTVNHEEEKSCHSCHRVRRALMNVNEDSLRNECEQRLRSEEAEKAAEPEPEEQSNPEHGGFWRTMAVVIPVLLLLAAVIFYVPRLLSSIVPLPEFPSSPNAQAETLAAPAEPTPIPTPTPEPTLSPEQIQEASYTQARQLLEEGRFSAARSALLQLGGYKDSQELAQEAVYRKAMNLYAFIDQYDERDVYALLSMDTGATNRFSLSTEKALDLGSQAVDSLRRSCGNDAVDVSMTEQPSEGLKPLASCVKELFSLLGDYKDSAGRLAALEDMTDYTRDFYMLCQAGNIFGAYDWLQSYPGEFPGRDHWLQLLDLYKPYCGTWVLYAGDYTLLPMTVGHQFPCMEFNSRVIINGDVATLRLLVREGESEFYIDLYSETGTTNFSYSDNGPYYGAAVNQVDHFAYVKFINGNIASSCEYERSY